jgi:SAM-dependent methyltransferase
MNPIVMKPHGAALRAYFDGDRSAELIIRRDDGQEARLPVSQFFREPATFTPIEKAALALCTGRVLDVGAGTGLHCLVLQQHGLRVTAIDISSQAAEVMAHRGVEDVVCADLFEYKGEPFDTLLLMGHGIGMVESHGLLTENGQLLLDSLDVRVTDDPGNLAYHDANRRSGWYIGETRVQFEYQDEKSPYCGWLHVDPGTLKEHASKTGWKSEVIMTEGSGEYLARLTKGRAT